MNPFTDILGMGKELGVACTDAKTYCRPVIKKTNKIKIISPDKPEDKYNLLTPQRVAAHLDTYKDEIILQYDKPQQSDKVFKNEKINSCKLTDKDIKLLIEEAREWQTIMNAPSSFYKGDAPQHNADHALMTSHFNLASVPIQLEADLKCGAIAKPGEAVAYRDDNFRNRAENHSYNITCKTMSSYCKKVEDYEEHQTEKPVNLKYRDKIRRLDIQNNKKETYVPKTFSSKSIKEKVAAKIAEKQLQRERQTITPEQRTIENYEHTQTNHRDADIGDKNTLTPEQRTIENYEHTQTNHRSANMRERYTITPEQRKIENYEHKMVNVRDADMRERYTITPEQRKIENFEHKQNTHSNSSQQNFHIDEIGKMNTVDDINREDYAHIYQDGAAKPY
jgi:hypothetical protein